MPTLLTKSLAASAVAGLCFVAAPQAQALNSFTLSGEPGSVSLEPPNNLAPNTSPDSIEATFSGPLSLSALDGDFTSVTDAVIDSPLTFTRETEGIFARYSLPSFDITFTGAGNGITTLTVFGPATPDGNYERLGNSTSSSIISDVVLEAFDNNGLAYTGSFQIIDSTNNNGLFSLTFTAVPEPLTLMGASAAIAFGAAFKRRRANKG